MKKTTKIITFLIILGVFIGSSANVAVANAWAKTDKHKVHLTAKVMGKVGVSDEELRDAFEESLGEEFNAEFVDQKGEGVEEVTVAIQVDDGDADDDGTPDAKDPDANGDGIPDSNETIATVDLDKEDPDLLNEVHDTKPGQGMNILIESNDEKHHILKMQTKADPPAEGSAQAFKFKNSMINGFASGSSRRFIPKWLKTTFTVVKYTAKGISCATGSFSACFGLLVDGYAR